MVFQSDLTRLALRAIHPLQGEGTVSLSSVLPGEGGAKRRMRSLHGARS